ncbi:hypothetical protein E2542_SST19151 [Spatholobus suberectus]|nr:hypothetical protein E2542_SST19151 [Spatholobus suberectus]
MVINVVLYVVDSQEMETSVVDTSIASRKCRRDEKDEEELEQAIFIVVSVVAMLLGVMAWYHDKYFVKELAQNWELERHSFLNRLYKGAEKDCIEQLKVIPNWDDIVDLCAKDKAIGIGAENALDANDIMNKEENKEEGVHSASIDLEESSSATKKKTGTSNVTNTKKQKRGDKSKGNMLGKHLKRFTSEANPNDIPVYLYMIHEMWDL